MMKSIKQLVLSVVIAGFICGQASATPPYLAAFELKYPTSTLSARMAASPLGQDCGVCHHSPDKFALGNCYREDIKALLVSMSIDEALDALDSVDSDNDGVPNGIEITAVRSDLPGEVGYSPGRVGPTGTDPCLGAGTPVATGQLETPPPAPAVSTWGLAVLTLSLMVAATILMRVRLSVDTVSVHR